jgi:PIN domain nuclease of toxin-antitoxin system
MTERSELLLDTHVWLWSFQGSFDRLGPDVPDMIDAAAAGGMIRVSIISVWEAVILVSKNRLHLTPSIDGWVQRSLGSKGVLLVGITPEIVIESARLPEFIEKDPVDRILVATARARGATLVTADRRILHYAKAGHLRVIDAAA